MKQSGPTQMLNANPDYQMPDTNQEEIMNIIKKLREHLDKTQLKKQHLFTACDNQARDVESGGKLDVGLI